MKIRPGIQLGNISDVGCEREKNEDYFGYFEPDDDAEYARKGRLAIVADGMGGMAGGYAASRTAVDVIHKEYVAHASMNPKEVLNDAILAANDVIFGQAEADPSLRGMGTTVTAMVLKGDLAYFAQVGDSRAYLIRGGQITQVTQDQTKVARLVAEGIISPEEAEDHPDAHILSQAVGNKVSVKVDTDMQPVEAKAGDIFLLCSDGLHGLVSDEELAGVASREDPNTACHTLVDLAKERGGHDNITVQIVKIPGTSLAAMPAKVGKPTGPLPSTPAPVKTAPPKSKFVYLVIGGVVLLIAGLAAGYFIFYNKPKPDPKKPTTDAGVTHKDSGPGQKVNPGEECAPHLTLCVQGKKRGCVNFDTNPEHCGRCFYNCGSRKRCIKGKCHWKSGAKKAKCRAPNRKCGVDCANLKADHKHCGKCGKKCKDAQTCTAGKCTRMKKCKKHFIACEGKCIDPRISPNHCGKCSKQCVSSICMSGRCAGEKCKAPKTLLCDGKCYDPKTDGKHCGRCNFECKSGPCVNGKCTVASTCIPATCKGKCVKGKCVAKAQPGCKKCGGTTCVDFKTDSKHCGKCKKACPGGQECKNAKCQCKKPFSMNCNSTCVNPNKDRNNCGGCGKSCNPGEICVRGYCGS